MIQIPGFPDYYVDGTDIISMKFGRRKVLRQRPDKDGYAHINICMHGERTTCKVHRLIAQAYLPDYSEDLQVDHIDRDKTNNRLENLRMATRSENRQNTDVNGFYYHKTTGKYLARIMTNGKRKHIGLYDTEEEARAAYLAAKVIHHPTYTQEVT
jgi:hypothetical protein